MSSKKSRHYFPNKNSKLGVFYFILHCTSGLTLWRDVGSGEGRHTSGGCSPGTSPSPPQTPAAQRRLAGAILPKESAPTDGECQNR